MSDESVEDAPGSGLENGGDGTAGGSHLALARDRLAAGDYEGAAGAYTLSAYERLGDLSSLDAGAGLALVPLTDLLRAALCLRVAGYDERAMNRAGQGLLVAEDLRDAVFEEDVLVGLAWEYVGDLRLVSGLYGVSEAYDRAQAVYADSDPTRPESWIHEDAVDGAAEVFRLVTANAGDPVDPATPDGTDGGTGRMLAARIATKRERYPAAVETVVESGELDPL